MRCFIAILAFTLWTSVWTSVAFAQCSMTKSDIDALRPFVKGEIAALTLLEEPRPLPALSVLNSEGQSLDFATLYGKPFLLNLWATWCLPCREEMPFLNELQDKKGDVFPVITVNLDTGSLEKGKEFYKTYSISNLEYYAEPTFSFFKTMKKFGRGQGLPMTLIVDQSGCEIGFLAGAAHWASEDALRFVDAVVVTRK